MSSSTAMYKIKHDIVYIYDNNHEKTIKNIEQEIHYLEVANTNQLISNFQNKKFTCLLQDVLPCKPTEESSKNRFCYWHATVVPHYKCSSKFPLNSTNCNEGNDPYKTNFYEQLKEIYKCHHQNYLDTKTIK